MIHNYAIAYRPKERAETRHYLISPWDMIFHFKIQKENARTMLAFIIAWYRASILFPIVTEQTIAISKAVLVLSCDLAAYYYQ